MPLAILLIRGARGAHQALPGPRHGDKIKRRLTVRFSAVKWATAGCAQVVMVLVLCGGRQLYGVLLRACSLRGKSMPGFARFCWAVHVGNLAGRRGAVMGPNRLCGAFAKHEAHDIGFAGGCEGNRVRHFEQVRDGFGRVAVLRGL